MLIPVFCQEGNIALDDIDTALQIIRGYKEFSNVYKDTENLIHFQCTNRRFVVELPKDETEYPHLLLEGKDDYTLPHIAQGNDAYGRRTVCIRREEEYVNLLLDFKDKIKDLCDRLICLMNLSLADQKREIGKEFMYYWNFEAVREFPVEVFLGEQDLAFTSLYVYKDKDNKKYRMVAPGTQLNDICGLDGHVKWKSVDRLPAFYIPLLSSEGIMPPIRGKPWNRATLLAILEEHHEKYMTNDCYHCFCNTICKGTKLFILLGIPIDQRREFCLVCVQSTTRWKASLIEKMQQAFSLSIYPCSRLDYGYLSNAIGNDNLLLQKKFLLIGAGSLGSYVGYELIKAGVRNLTVYDEDSFEKENTFRWSFPMRFSYGRNKTRILKAMLESINPEIMICAKPMNMSMEELRSICNMYDGIIFTVGSSDFQFQANKVLHDIHYRGLCFYAWLEAGGIYSHVLSINYNNPGCYQCLFTDGQGSLVNNQYNHPISEEQERNAFIDNACGGARAVYGNAILLRTTAVLLNCMKKAFMNHMSSNFLMDIGPNENINREDSFVRKGCNCCGSNHW